MTGWAALLRAVNVGSTGALPMAELRAIGAACGFAAVGTYIASGNLVFASPLHEGAIKAALQAALAQRAGRPAQVFVRSAAQLAEVVAANPFPGANGSRHMVFFYDHAPPPDLIAQCRDRAGEQLALGLRELHVDCGAGIRTTTLKIPAKLERTGRNMNTVRKLASLLAT